MARCGEGHGAKDVGSARASKQGLQVSAACAKPAWLTRPDEKEGGLRARVLWHGRVCPGGRLPESNVEFCRAKIRGNQARDAKAVGELECAGWQVCAIWECEMGDQELLGRRLIRFLDGAQG